MSNIETLVKYVGSENIAELLNDDSLLKISRQVIDGTKLDEDSRSQWLSVMQKGMDIARQVYEKKSTPWENAANVKFPLIANGAITFAAREYPQIVRGDKVVEVAVFGKDPDGMKSLQAARLSKFMSWQLLSASTEWEQDTDKLLHMLAVVGIVFRKVYFSPIQGKPVFELCDPLNIIINNNAKSLEKAVRITHKIELSSNDIVERQRIGIFCEHDIDGLDQGKDNEAIDAREMDACHELLEQHCWLDLDEDGYKEPYIVTVHKKSEKIMRIVSRFNLESIEFNAKNEIKCIKPDQYFIDYHFIPDPNGSFYSLGFGTLLYPLNESINTLMNQLLDSGTLHNLQSGFIGSGCRIEGGKVKFSPGQWTRIEGVGGRDLPNSIMALPTKEPSAVLFQLLGLMIDVGKEMASINDILQGQQPAQNSPATTVLALIKQGLTQYNAVHKRVLRSFKKEFERLFILNSQYLNEVEYLNMIDDQLATAQDFDIDNLNVRPVADPNMSSDAQRMARAQAVMSLPTVNPHIATTLYLEALELPEAQIKALAPTPDPQAPPPGDEQKKLAEAEKLRVEAQSIMLDHRANAAEMELKMRKMEAELEKIKAEINMFEMQGKLNGAMAVKALADADTARVNANTAQAKVNVDAYLSSLDKLDRDNPHQEHKDAVEMLAPNEGDEYGIPEETNEDIGINDGSMVDESSYPEIDTTDQGSESGSSPIVDDGSNAS